MSRWDLFYSVVAILVGVCVTNIAAYSAGRAEGLNVHDCDHARTAEVWRSLYLRAEEDAKVMNCTPLDNNYFMCEKKAHAQR